MAAWQVEFELIPDRVLRAASGVTPDALANTHWWEGVAVPRDYQARLDGVAPRAPSSSPQVETWGDADGNRVDVWSGSGGVTKIVARVDVRRLDARFGAGLLLLVRHLGGTLVRRDGVVVKPTIGAFGAALRGTAAWRSANEQAAESAADAGGQEP